jgi:methylated-DNA-protein-cysteine methyltransferase-like protein
MPNSSNKKPSLPKIDLRGLDRVGLMSIAQTRGGIVGGSRPDEPNEPITKESFGEFADQVHKIVASVPRGRVVTYGDIARATGSARRARMVGWVLNRLPEENGLPCHRVVNKDGYLSGGWQWGHPEIMKALLLAEKVPFREDYVVDLGACRWFPWEGDLAAADEMDNLDLIAGHKSD